MSSPPSGTIAVRQASMSTLYMLSAIMLVKPTAVLLSPPPPQCPHSKGCPNAQITPTAHKYSAKQYVWRLWPQPAHNASEYDASSRQEVEVLCHCPGALDDLFCSPSVVVCKLTRQLLCEVTEL